jgi:hypothetical protein
MLNKITYYFLKRAEAQFAKRNDLQETANKMQSLKTIYFTYFVK